MLVWYHNTLTYEEPFKEHHCRIQSGFIKAVSEHLKEMLQTGFIFDSENPFFLGKQKISNDQELFGRNMALYGSVLTL